MVCLSLAGFGTGRARGSEWGCGDLCRDVRQQTPGTARDDEQLLHTVYEALAKRRPNSRTRGRWGTPAEVVLRLLLLKHIRN